MLLLWLLLLLLRCLLAQRPTGTGEDIHLYIVFLPVFAASYTPCNSATSLSTTVREERLEDSALLPTSDEGVLLRRILDCLEQGTTTVGPQMAFYEGIETGNGA